MDSILLEKSQAYSNLAEEKRKSDEEIEYNRTEIEALSKVKPIVNCKTSNIGSLNIVVFLEN